MRKDLPKQISVSTPELALAVGAYFSSKGWDVQPNLSNHKSYNKEFYSSKNLGISIYTTGKVISWGSIDKIYSNHFVSLKDFILWIEEGLEINGKEVKIYANGYQIGDESPVTWDQFNKIYELKQKLGY